jgi:hypothetical protein
VAELAPWLSEIERNYSHQFLQRTEHLDLPKTLLAAEHLFGRSSQTFDDYKGSFRFPLFLSASRDGLDLQYVVLLADCRGSIEVVFARYSEQCRQIWPGGGFAAPVDNELSRAELDYLSDHVRGYLVGLGHTLVEKSAPFYRVIPSQRVVYGLRAGELFERSIDSAEDFEDVRAAIARDLGEHEDRRDTDSRSALLADISHGVIRCR